MKGNKKRIPHDDYPCYVWLERYLSQGDKITKRIIRKGRATFGVQNEMAWVFEREREIQMCDPGEVNHDD